MQNQPTTQPPLFSILMPVYNAAATLEAAARSVLDQSQGDLELLLVDDGSADGSLALARSLAAADPRVRVFAQKNGGICAFDITYLDLFEAVRVIREAGGLAVLAHSGQQKNFSLIPSLVSCGLAGLELNHPSHSEQDRAEIREYASEYGLFLTGGSDFHGEYEPDAPGIGSFLAEESGAEAICSE